MSESRSTGWRKFAADCKEIGDALQPFVIVFGGLFALMTYVDAANKDQDARLRELQRPYYDKQLDLYLEAARVAAHLAASPPTDPVAKEELVARFWELYWGQLAFVESRGGSAQSTTGTPVEALMVRVCESYVSADDPAKCHAAENQALTAAINLAHQASDEIRSRWLAPPAVEPQPVP